MNTVKVMNLKKSSIKLRVKVGSHKLTVNITKDTSCNDLIKMCLKECKIKTTSVQFKNYVLIERAQGVERVIVGSQNMFELLMQWNCNYGYELLIKLGRSYNRVSNIQATSTQNVYQLKSEANQILKAYSINNINTTNAYETIDEEMNEYSAHLTAINTDTSKNLSKNKSAISSTSILKHFKNVKKIIGTMNLTTGNELKHTKMQSTSKSTNYLNNQFHFVFGKFSRLEDTDSIFSTQS